ncbi:hypothetical protein BDQ12DRAFT_674301 [Crucibulum laeve]|uniref:Transferase family-domain-containing protein n=1 Tax=Crucibulum laeve TaxID=68775 RepID=A0A5C3MC62_9AGAR|nr:hypothetical protein BDQ12DRAFT_674301 [Crucibulum laeve]
MAGSASEREALFPLTVFDRLFERTTFVTGWLVRGTVDAEALGSALGRVTQKWRMLSGRLQSVKHGNGTKWHIRIPLGSLSPDYQTYALTTATSDLPLTHYVTVPLPRLSPSLPYSLLVHPSTPRNYAKWESTGHPLTCWHLTHFPAETSEDGNAYTSIGFARCHGVFDGVGAALVMRALIAEINGTEWEIPTLPQEGQNINPMQEILDPLLRSKDIKELETGDYRGFSVLGILGGLKLIGWHLREKFWRGAQRNVVLLPNPVVTAIVKRVRSELKDHSQRSEAVTTGDVLVAWIMKTVYADGTVPETTVYCSNLGSFRSHLPTKGGSLATYPHNAFVPVPYPTLTVADINSLSLSSLTHLLATTRASMSVTQVLLAHRTLEKSVTAFPLDSSADETLTISNVSASRILESDWSGVGGKETLCGYRYQLTPTEVLWTNAVYLAGRLADGTTVLDVTLSTHRLGLLTAEIETQMASLEE